MFPYDNMRVYSFVFLFDLAKAEQSLDCTSVGQILTRAGFTTQDGGAIRFRLCECSVDGTPQEAFFLRVNGWDCSLVARISLASKGRYVELYFGGAVDWKQSVFFDECRTLELRDQLLSCVNEICALDGFDVGFSVLIGKKEEQSSFDDLWRRAIVEGRFQLTRLMYEMEYLVHVILLGAPYTNRYGVENFMRCPAWRKALPRDGVVCLYLSNPYLSCSRLRQNAVYRSREGYKYLAKFLNPPPGWDQMEDDEKGQQ